MEKNQRARIEWENLKILLQQNLEKFSSNYSLVKKKKNRGNILHQAQHFEKKIKHKNTKH